MNWSRESQYGTARASIGDGVFVASSLRYCGHGVVVEPGARLFFPENIALGDRTYVAHDAIIHGYHCGLVEIGEDCWIGPQACIHGAGRLYVEAAVGIGPAVVVLTSRHADTDSGLPVLAERLEFAPVRLCYGADIGARSVVLPGVTVGERSVVGAGSVVSRDVPEGSVFAGVPARLLRQRRMPEAAEDS